MVNDHDKGFLRTVVSEFSEDEAMTLAAALAYYAALSLAPMVLLMVWIGDLLGPQAKQRLIEQVEAQAGPQAGQSVQMVVENASSTPELGTIAGIISIAATILAATGVLAQLQYAMNRIWDVNPRGSGVRGWLKKRALSLLMILVIGGVLLASLVMTTIVSGLRESGTIPGPDYLWRVAELGISLVVLTLLFAAVFHFLPDTDVGWRPTWIGALVTAVLFIVGKWVVGLYLAHSSSSSAYGAAGSLIVLLVWVYYCAVIFFFGAELTQVWARRHGWKLTRETPRGGMVHA